MRNRETRGKLGGNSKSVGLKKDMIQYIHYKSLQNLLQRSKTIKALKKLDIIFLPKSYLTYSLYFIFHFFPWFAENLYAYRCHL